MRKTDKSSRTNKPPKISVNGGSIGTSKDQKFIFFINVLY